VAKIAHIDPAHLAKHKTWGKLNSINSEVMSGKTKSGRLVRNFNWSIDDALLWRTRKVLPQKFVESNYIGVESHGLFFSTAAAAAAETTKATAAASNTAAKATAAAPNTATEATAAAPNTATKATAAAPNTATKATAAASSAASRAAEVFEEETPDWDSMEAEPEETPVVAAPNQPKGEPEESKESVAEPPMEPRSKVRPAPKSNVTIAAASSSEQMPQPSIRTVRLIEAGTVHPALKSTEGWFRSWKVYLYSFGAEHMGTGHTAHYRNQLHVFACMIFIVHSTITSSFLKLNVVAAFFTILIAHVHSATANQRFGKHRHTHSRNTHQVK
jgi:hypothetical protein